MHLIVGGLDFLADSAPLGDGQSCLLRPLPDCLRSFPIAGAWGGPAAAPTGWRLANRTSELGELRQAVLQLLSMCRIEVDLELRVTKTEGASNDIFGGTINIIGHNYLLYANHAGDGYMTIVNRLGRDAALQGCRRQARPERRS